MQAGKLVHTGNVGAEISEQDGRALDGLCALSSQKSSTARRSCSARCSAKPARSAVGVAELPLGAPIEVEIVVEID
jgi:enamine deaminase RidA (YjgF/YER057c/UK114 family)